MKDDLLRAKGGLAQGELQRQQLSRTTSTTTSHGSASNRFENVCADSAAGNLREKWRGSLKGDFENTLPSPGWDCGLADTAQILVHSKFGIFAQCLVIKTENTRGYIEFGQTFYFPFTAFISSELFTEQGNRLFLRWRWTKPTWASWRSTFSRLSAHKQRWIFGGMLNNMLFVA